MPAGRPRSRIKRNCLYCLKEFECYKNDAERGYAKFCSKVCGYANKTSYYKKPCEQCGELFKAAPHKEKIGWARFCGRACYALYSKIKRESDLDL